MSFSTKESSIYSKIGSYNPNEENLKIDVSYDIDCYHRIDLFLQGRESTLEHSGSTCNCSYVTMNYIECVYSQRKILKISVSRDRGFKSLV